MKRITLLAILLLSAVVSCKKEKTEEGLTGAWNIMKTEEYDSQGKLIESTPFCGDYVEFIENYVIYYSFGDDSVNGLLLPYVYNENKKTIIILQGESTVEFKSSDKMIIRTSDYDGYEEVTYERFKQVKEEDYAKKIVGTWKYVGAISSVGETVTTYKPEENDSSYEMVLSSDGKATYQNYGENAGLDGSGSNYYALINNRLYFKPTKDEIKEVLHGKDPEDGMMIRMGQKTLVLYQEFTILGITAKMQYAYIRVK